jgi:hypothetical protein
MTIKEKEKLVKKLSDQWYALMGKQHHKDKDCHWTIETNWSYGNKQTYTVVHHGYLVGDFYEEFNSYEKALDYLIGQIGKYIKTLKTYQKADEM